MTSTSETRCAEGTKTAGETLQRSTVELQGVLEGFVRTLTIRFEVPDEPLTSEARSRSARVLIASGAILTGDSRRRATMRLASMRSI